MNGFLVWHPFTTTEDRTETGIFFSSVHTCFGTRFFVGREAPRARIAHSFDDDVRRQLRKQSTLFYAFVGESRK